MFLIQWDALIFSCFFSFSNRYRVTSAEFLRYLNNVFVYAWLIANWSVMSLFLILLFSRALQNQNFCMTNEKFRGKSCLRIILICKTNITGKMKQHWIFPWVHYLLVYLIYIDFFFKSIVFIIYVMIYVW